jgi:hypothetical protein
MKILKTVQYLKHLLESKPLLVVLNNILFWFAVNASLVRGALADILLCASVIVTILTLVLKGIELYHKVKK